MRRALDLAEAGWGRVHPNPLVGAVVVRDGEVVGEGAHREFGEAHAEIEALRAAGEAAAGATLYVTLEPCAHHGKTPPCTDAVLSAGVRRLVYAAADASPEAAGGAARLAAQGVEVTGGVEAEAARVQNAAFFHALGGRGPWTVLKYALSVDGRLARRSGEPTRVTGDVARRDAHRLRAGFDAIIIGAGTAAVDDPLLTARGDVRPRVPPLRVVVDAEARLAPGSRLFRTVEEAPVRVYHAPDAAESRVATLRAAGIEARAVSRAEGGLDLAAVLEDLHAGGARAVLCEGGGRLGAALLAGDRVDRLITYVAPVLFGRGGVDAFDGPVPDGAAWRRTRVAVLGDDVRLDYDRRREDD